MMLKRCGFQSPEGWGQHVPLKTPWARLSKPLLEWARVSPQNRTSHELEILGSRENQGRKKSILIKLPIPACWQTGGIFPSLPALLACPAMAMGWDWDCSPQGREDVPWWVWISAWHRALPHPQGRQGKSMDMGTIWSWGFSGQHRDLCTIARAFLPLSQPPSGQLGCWHCSMYCQPPPSHLHQRQKLRLQNCHKDKIF